MFDVVGHLKIKMHQNTSKTNHSELKLYTLHTLKKDLSRRLLQAAHLMNHKHQIFMFMFYKFIILLMAPSFPLVAALVKV